VKRRASRRPRRRATSTGVRQVLLVLVVGALALVLLNAGLALWRDERPAAAAGAGVALVALLAVAAYSARQARRR
jgi:lipopolysaccharide export LptBFGC system permease protein LptF